MFVVRSVIMILVLATALGVLLGGGIGFLVVTAMGAYQ